MSIEIEVSTPESVADALPLLAAQFDEHRIELDRPALERAVRGLVAVDGRGRILFAREGSRVVGSLGGSAPKPPEIASAAPRSALRVVGVAVMAYTWTLEHGGRVTWLEELYVVPEQRSMGIGTKLLQRAIEVAKSDGCIAMDLEVDVEHVRAERLYVRGGFKPLPRRRFAKKL